MKEDIYKGRIPRFLMLLGSVLGLLWVVMAYFGRGPMNILTFGSYGKFFVALVTYILLVIVAVRANFKCGRISCPAVFSVIFLLAYYSYPPFLRYWGFILLAIALYIIFKTLVHHKKRSH